MVQTVNQNDAMTLMLLVAHFLALAVAVMVFLWMVFLQRRNRAAEKFHLPAGDIFPSGRTSAIRPTAWLAVRTLEPQAVRAALADKDEFFISPRVNGWVIVTGPGLPDPGEDVDECFRFLTATSRKLGHVQFFYMEKFSAHHAWVRMDEGCVTRAYAWAGETIWNQGAKSLAENRLGLKCSGYGDDSEIGFWTMKQRAAENVEKIPLLAARWSLDPEILHRAGGISGGSSRLY
jgi:hypothetical protein